MIPRRHDDSLWAVRYVATGDIAPILAGIRTYAEEANLRLEVARDADGSTRIRGRQRGLELRALVGARPMVVEWIVRPNGERTVLTADFRLAGWMTGLLAAMYGGSVISALVCGRALLAIGLADRSFVALTAAMTALVSLAITLVLLFALLDRTSKLLGRPPFEAFVTISASVLAAGGTLDEEMTGASPRYLFAFRGQLGTVLFLLMWLLVEVVDDQFFRVVREFSSVYLGIAVALLFAFIAVAVVFLVASRRRGFPRRSALLTPGFVTLFALMLYLFAFVPWMTTAYRMEAISFWFAGHPGNVGIAVPLDHRLIARVMRKDFFRGGTGTLLLPILFSTYSIALLVSAWLTVRRAVKHTEHVWSQAQLLRRDRGGEVATLARRDQKLLGVVRFATISVWAIVSMFVGLLLTLVALAAAGSGAAGFRPLLHGPGTCIAVALAALTPIPPAHCYTVARVLLSIYAAVPITAISVATGQLLRRRRGERTAAPPEAVAILEELCRGRASSPPELVIRPSSIPFAHASVSRGRARIDVSSTCLEVLLPGELRALLAHELAHIELHHCRIDALLILIGRLTLVGNTFVRALQDSLGYEHEADRAVTERFGVPAASLRTCLLKLRHIAAATTGTNAPDGLPFIDSGTDGMVSAWRRYVHQFFLAGHLAYWHPSLDERIARLPDGGVL